MSGNFTTEISEKTRILHGLPGCISIKTNILGPIAFQLIA